MTSSISSPPMSALRLNPSPTCVKYRLREKSNFTRENKEKMERIAEEIGSFDHIELVVCTSPMQSSKFANFARIKKTLQGRFRY